jgi:hypothetical protein
MPPLRPRRWSASALAVLAAACAAAPPAAPSHLHAHARTLTVTDAAILPGPDVRIPAFATVVWRNGGSTPMQVALDAAPCRECATVLGFAAADGGAATGPIAPQDIAALCFHEPGEFAFVVRRGAVAHRGTIAVGGRP